MFAGSPKLTDIYATPKPELPDDDMSFLRSMIERPPPPADPIDYDFLKAELAKRRPAPQPKPKGIELIEPQVKPSTHVPKYLKIQNDPISSKRQSRGASRLSSINMDEDIVDITPPDSNFHSMAQSTEELINTEIQERFSPVKPARKPKKYVAWKYIGDMDGELGVMSGKLDIEKEKENGRNIASDFANLPYITNQYKRPVQPKVRKPRVRPRDLFKLSIAKDSREAVKQRSRMNVKNLEDYDPANNDYQLYLRTDDGLVPIKVSRLQ